MPTTDRSAELAAELATRLGVSRPMPLRPQDEALLQGATPFRFGPDEGRPAWSLGEGPLVLMTHGWGGRGVQMASLAHALAGQGLRCVFFDAGGHGDAVPEPVGFHTFVKDVADLTRRFDEPVHGWVGHSAGALGMMRARALHGVSAERYVCISAPRFPYVPIETMRRTTGAPEYVLDRVKPIVAAQLNASWEELEDGLAFAPEPGRPLLLVYGHDDERVRHADADAIAGLWPGAEILKTAGFGHNRILQAPDVIAGVAAFLRSRG